jgi:glycosyltransferase involved in cell wall biosynthesis
VFGIFLSDVSGREVPSMIHLSAVINVKNEEEMLPECLRSLSFCDEIVVIDTGSSDNTINIAHTFGAKVFSYMTQDFSEMKVFGQEKARGEWLLYIDADERVSPKLQQSVQDAIQSDVFVGYTITRQNYYFGNHAWPKKESFLRLFRKAHLKKWHGTLHETAIVDGKIGQLQGELLHYTHRNLSSMVKKTLAWSKIEAELRYNAHHPPMTWWRFPRVMLTAFMRSYVIEKGWRMGTVGLIESLYQAFSVFITYARLWELQIQGEKKQDHEAQH